MLAATVCSLPGKTQKPQQSREQLVERLYSYRNRISKAEDVIADQKQQLGQLRQQIGSMQGEIGQVQAQCDAERTRMQALEREVFSLRRTKRPRSEPAESKETESLRRELKRVLLACHPDHAKNQTFTSHQLTSAITGLLSGEPAERCLPKI